jgi:hypothetical protein
MVARTVLGGSPVGPLEQLFLLVVRFYQRLRTEAPGTVDVEEAHISYALQTGYELFFRAAGRVTAGDLAQLAERHLAAGDARDVLAARDFLTDWLCLRPSWP